MNLAQRIRRCLTDDLRRSPWKGNENPLAGHCYVASEALFHLSKEKLFPHFIRHEGQPHWFLKDSKGRVFDLTSEQFRTFVDYNSAVRKGFLTRKPSKRAKILMKRVKRDDYCK